MTPFLRSFKKSGSCFAMILLGTYSALADPLDTPVQDGSGVVWANHDSGDGVYKQISFQSILGVGYRIEKSNDLVNWTNFAQFYGVGNTVTWNLFASPVPENQNGGGNGDPVEEDTRKNATLVMNKADTGELVLGWTSLDTAEAVQHVLTGLSIADEWGSNPIVGHSTDNHHFTMILAVGYNGVIPPNSQLGALDAAMIVDFSSNFATINQSVIDNAAASQLAPPPLPPDPSSKAFFRLAVNAKLDSDFDGIPDVLEYQNGNSASFSYDSDGDGFSDGAENDQGTNPNDSNDKPEIEALIVTGNAEEGVEVSQKRKIIIPAGSPNRLIVVALQSDEYPSYTSGDLCEGECPFNDQLRWIITPSNGETISGQVDVNDLHEKWENESDTFLGRSPVHFQEVKVVESKPDQDVVVEVEGGSTNIEDGALPSTVVVASIPVEIVPDDNQVGVTGDEIPSNKGDEGEKHYVSPKKSTEIPNDYVILKAKGISEENFAKFLRWEGGEAIEGSPLKRRVKRDATKKEVVKLLTKKDDTEADKMNVWVVWSDITTVNDGVAGKGFFTQEDEQGLKYARWWVVPNPANGRKFKCVIKPALIITDNDRPALNGQKNKLVPGEQKQFVIDPNTVADEAENKWDMSRRFLIKVKNSGGILKGQLGQPTALFVNQPENVGDPIIAVDTPVQLPQNPVEGNDDPPFPEGAGKDEATDPYQARNEGGQKAGLNHQIGEMASFDSPQHIVLNSWGVDDREYGMTFNYQEFARVELWDSEREGGKFWFRISDYLNWHHALEAKYTSGSARWNNNGSSSEVGHK